MQVTKFDHLTTPELLHEAYHQLDKMDELATALYLRLCDITDEKELADAEDDACCGGHCGGCE